MLNSPILAAGFFMNVLLVVWILCSLALILIVLIQKGKGGGLSGAFGGGMATNILGANTKKPLTWFTIGLVCVFLFLAVLLAKFYPRSSVEVIAPPTPASQPGAPTTPGTTTPGTTVPTGTPTATIPARGGTVEVNIPR
jgi:preprotein translocase subunit SecG